jgi:hypothetical protein
MLPEVRPPATIWAEVEDMHPYLKSRRRLLVVASRTYMEAEDAWRSGLREASVFLADAAGRRHCMIGNPGSRIRRLYDERERAVERLTYAQMKLHVARERLNALERAGQRAVVVDRISR